MKNNGLTLLELLIVLALLLILQYLIFPSLHYWFAMNRMTVVMNRLKHEIDTARNDAMQRQHIVQLCGSANQKTCDGQWHSGQMIVDSINGEIIQKYQSFPKQYKL